MHSRVSPPGEVNTPDFKIPSACARLTRSVRLVAPIRRNIIATCCATVYLLMCKFSPICTLVKPRATSFNMLISRRVNFTLRRAGGSAAAGIFSGTANILRSCSASHPSSRGCRPLRFCPRPASRAHRERIGSKCTCQRDGLARSVGRHVPGAERNPYLRDGGSRGARRH
jgi:hypothetical protein